MAFLVATTSLPAVYRPNGYARTTTAGTPHARAKIFKPVWEYKGCHKKILPREIGPNSSDIPTIGPVIEHLDREYW